MNILKIIGIIVGVIVVVIVAFFAIMKYYLSKKDPNYVLNYIKEQKDDETCSLLIRRNGEVLTSINGNKKLPLASMAKIVIAVEFAKQVSEGKISRDERISLHELEKYYVKNTDGGAHPAWLEDIHARELVKNEQIALEEVTKGMIHYSSNANTTYLLEKLGIERVNESIKELELTSHDKFTSYTASLYMRGYVEKELHVPENQSLKTLRNMSKDEYNKHVLQIHEWMKDEEEWKKRDIPLKVDMEFQRIWSDRLVGANAKDYMSIMEKINSRNYFPKSMQDEIENVFNGTVKNSKFEYAGQKGGSTAFVLTKSLYTTDKKGNKVEVVIMFNDIDDQVAYQKLRNNVDYFILDMLANEEFRNK
ncbi:D-alanyl-D-alanine carboxypeptidase [Bacillus cereus]|uniref:D-alanyl-D-alanine carboxypeptidase n=1 Tax=Bacillus cereus TaxID=1396 RepID=A0A2A8LSR1_BACCE|nr:MULTISPECIES: serine hydrolase [Bacillus cereus group]MDR4985241.1 serine hydrolase [Bacillus cereus]MEA1009375.1 serine hydrolase [Bacillus cereus]PES97192.1 D-alanyl-D-alanine carboxypeptidase [Bacillus cereus]PFP76164.1 D-alanyl-D-alanine carboxypeptidase [Bacillus cereus]PGT20147.1 D-alanyl-D-alanine carboxypeptidase [Bacillus cereus]